MSLDLALIRFVGETKAASVFGAMRAHAGSDEAPWTHEVALVEHHRNGRLSIRGTFASHHVDVNETHHGSEPGAAEGALTGALVGAVFGPPGFAAEFVLGGTRGAEVGRATEVEAAPEGLLSALHSAVPGGASAIVLLAAAERVDAMLAAVRDSDGALFRRTLTAEQVATLTAAVSQAPLALSGPTQSGAVAASQT